jgi:hypothetical protein
MYNCVQIIALVFKFLQICWDLRYFCAALNTCAKFCVSFHCEAVDEQTDWELRLCLILCRPEHNGFIMLISWLRQFLKAIIDELETDSKNKNIVGLYRGISDFKKGYQPRTNIVKDEKVDLFTVPQYFG